MAKQGMHRNFDESTKRLVEFAKQHGFSLERTKGSHLKFTRPGVTSVFFSSTTSDRRAALNCKSQIRHALHNAAAPAHA